MSLFNFQGDSRGGGQGGGQGRGGGQGGGQRRGRGMSTGKGPGGNCVCSNCGATVPHEMGKPCNTVKCPECGQNMVRG